MYTGIITDLGKVKNIQAGGMTRLEVETSFDVPNIEMGASIGCNGICLTVVEKGNNWLAFQASQETLNKTTLGKWSVGTPINLERSLKMGDEIGGHWVFGHVDGVAKLVSREPEGDSIRMVFAVPENLAKYMAPKGCVALDGISLTVNEVDGNCFGVNIIPHTAKVTNFGVLQVGQEVNIEVDMMARYVARILGKEE